MGVFVTIVNELKGVKKTKMNCLNCDYYRENFLFNCCELTQEECFFIKTKSIHVTILMMIILLKKMFRSLDLRKELILKRFLNGKISNEI